MNEQPLLQPDPEFVERVKASFSRQAFMSTLGAGLARFAMGEVDISPLFRGDLTQQHGIHHAAATTAPIA